MNANPEPDKDTLPEDIEKFDFEFDEDFESEVSSEYVVMDALSFDREAGTAECDFELDDDEENESDNSNDLDSQFNDE